ncbi:MAG: hypothetical protein CMJ06_02405 [Pelagibacterales bacterium]|nr:hypothetical protein [Pelagibacterales bacterium]|tara:strand:+ start:2144 stop:3163 length:1020 start_codon:yes stop_codon:yes gene_type:complete
MNNISKKKLLLVLFFSIGIFTVIYLAKILIPFFIGILVAYLLDPIVDFLEDRKIKRSIGTTVTLVLFFSIIFILGFFIFPILLIQIKSFLIEFPTIITNLNQKFNLLIDYIQKKVLVLNEQETINNFLPSISNLITGFINNLISSSFAMFNLITIVLITPIVAWYFLKDWDLITSNFYKLLSSKYKKKIIAYTNDINSIFNAYLRGQILVSFSLTVFYFFSFYTLGLNYSLFVGIFAGFFSFIPFIGILISLFITSILTYLQFLDYYMVLYILLIFFIGQLLESNFLTPKLIGKKLGLHPLAVLFAIFIFGSLFGIIGIIFATPLMATFTLILKNNLKN